MRSGERAIGHAAFRHPQYGLSEPGEEVTVSFSPPDVFRTPRLRVRRATRDDAEPLFRAFTGSGEATRYLTWTRDESADDTAKFLAEVALPEWQRGSSFHWTVETLEAPEVIGMLSLHPGAHGIELGAGLSEHHWGQGLTAEAVRPAVDWALGRPDVYRVWGTCDCENSGSARVLEKLSFELEGTLRRWSVRPNLSDEPRDAYCYSILT